MISHDDKSFRLNRATIVRRALLCVFPIISIFFKQWMGTVVVSVISLLAMALDKTRNQRRVMSFLLFLLIVWFIQLLVFALIFVNVPFVLGLSSVPRGVPEKLDDPDVAMLKWAEYDKSTTNIHENEVDSLSSKFPWMKEFPPLASTDPKPVIKTASVILAAHNEHKYLERTIESIVAESPDNELIEIIIVDDASDPPLSDITDKMDMKKLGKVDLRIIRHDDRQGLIRSKTDGARASKGDLVIFLDAHVKPEPHWLTPLFRHTNENYKRVVVPLIPILNGDTWTVDTNAVGIKMMFDWGLGFNWFDDGDDFVPVMSGGLLAITRRYWYESGEYDDKMLYWGGENIEQSVRIWLCGGEIVVARDSRVSHVFRPSFPYSIDHRQVNINKVRTVEVWFDEYKEFYYKSDPFARTLIASMDDTSEREELKKRLQCKPFQYFVDRFRAVFDMKSMLPKKHVAIKDEITGKCVKRNPDSRLKLMDCDKATGSDAMSAMRFIVENGAIRPLKQSHECFDANGSAGYVKDNVPILTFPCVKNNAQQSNWRIQDGGIQWQDKYCAKAEDGTQRLVFGTCSSKPANNNEFLGSKFFGHPNHRFVILDERSTEVAKSDNDLRSFRERPDDVEDADQEEQL